ncbi:hypothetical protein F5Y10DRAFT_18706 [Nemania abortiva]|nr:hypothetical protein F5Y10DRAFT_18706 [Nemania abortiva]
MEGIPSLALTPVQYYVLGIAVPVLAILIVPCVTHPIAFDMSYDAAAQSLHDELKGNIFHGVDGFYAKYFTDKPWSTAIHTKISETKSAQVLSTDVLRLNHMDGLMGWLATFQSLFFAANQTDFHFRSQPISTADSPFSASIYLETSKHQVVAGSTRVFGEYHYGDAPNAAKDDREFQRFCVHALQVFKAQSAWHFLHAFLVRGNTLELYLRLWRLIFLFLARS